MRFAAVRVSGFFLLALGAAAQAQTASTTTASAPTVIATCADVTNTATQVANATCGLDPVTGAKMYVTNTYGYILTASDYADLQLAEAPFSYTQASSLFGLGFFLPFVSYVMAWPLGLLLRMFTQS